MIRIAKPSQSGTARVLAVKARPLLVETAPLPCPLILTGPGDALGDALHRRAGPVLLLGDRHALHVRLDDRRTLFGAMIGFNIGGVIALGTFGPSLG